MKDVWKLALLGIAGLVLAGAAIGIVSAQDSGGATPDADVSQERDVASLRADYLALLAENLGITQEALVAGLTQTALDMVDQALADGKITEEKAAEIRERIESGEAPLFPGFGKGFKHGVGVGVGIGVKLADLAEFLGVELADIRTGLEEGQTLAQIAEANGVSADELAAHLLSNLEAKLAEAVESGKMTQEKADEILANAPERIDELINREGPFRPHQFGSRGGPMDGGSVEPPIEVSSITF